MAANSVLIVGESGSGKSTSIENLPAKETFIVNVSSKDLPFRGWKKNYTEFNKTNPGGNLLNTDNAATIVATLKHVNEKRPEIKYIVIEDAQYIMANEYMRRSKETGFTKFADIAKSFFDIATAPKEMRSDVTVFFLMHAEEGTDINQNRRLKAKTIGKMMDNTITLEGLFTVVLFTSKEEVKNGIEYAFITNGDPNSTAKSPRGMFEAKIPNDLMKVVEGIRAYEE
jgi:predicted ATPase